MELYIKISDLKQDFEGNEMYVSFKNFKPKVQEAIRIVGEALYYRGSSIADKKITPED